MNEAILGEGPLNHVGDERYEGDEWEDAHGRKQQKLAEDHFEVLVRELELRPERAGGGRACRARTTIGSRRKFLAITAWAAEGAGGAVEKGHDVGDDVVNEQIGEHEQLRSISSQEGRQRVGEGQREVVDKGSQSESSLAPADQSCGPTALQARPTFLRRRVALGVTISDTISRARITFHV